MRILNISDPGLGLLSEDNSEIGPTLVYFKLVSHVGTEYGDVEV